MKAKGIEKGPGISVDYQAYKEQQYDQLADELRKHLDMSRIYEIMGVER